MAHCLNPAKDRLLQAVFRTKKKKKECESYCKICFLPLLIEPIISYYFVFWKRHIFMTFAWLLEALSL